MAYQDGAGRWRKDKPWHDRLCEVRALMKGGLSLEEALIKMDISERTYTQYLVREERQSILPESEQRRRDRLDYLEKVEAERKLLSVGLSQEDVNRIVWEKTDNTEPDK
jgi:hypothetical protein